MGVMLVCPHEFYLALCGITGKNVAPSLSLVAHPRTHDKSLCFNMSNRNSDV